MKLHRLACVLAAFVASALAADVSAAAAERPNIVLVMADDQGWSQVGYNGHPHLKTPNLDAMAEAGIRFNRFYAAASTCSPTRASVLTGRSPKRTGVPAIGNRLCLQEKTLPQALKRAGYATGHFGKWHLGGVGGPGVPVLGDDPNHPGRYGFDHWLSATNFFDNNPLMSRMGEFVYLEGESSELMVQQALGFMNEQGDTPFLAVIWFGSPHFPFIASDQDTRGLPAGKKGRLANHLGEIVAIDRSIGMLRKGLREMGIEQNTLIWYTSDNGGLKDDPDSTGNLRGNKGSLYEGGIRVPGIIAWPGRIKPMVTDFPASTMDIMPTIIDLLGLPEDAQLPVRDGESIAALFEGNTPERKRLIPFTSKGSAFIDGKFKLMNTSSTRAPEWVLFDLLADPGETRDVSADHPERFMSMKDQAEQVLLSVEASALGKDYPEGRVVQPPRSERWFQMPAYEQHFKAFAELKPGFKVPKENPNRKRNKQEAE